MQQDINEVQIQQDGWDRFIQTQRKDIGFVQSSWWADLQASVGWSHFGVFFRDGEQILGGARLLCRESGADQCYYYVPEGPVLPSDPDDADQLLQAFLDHLDDRRRRSARLVTHLVLEPRWFTVPPLLAGFRQAGSWREPRNTLMVDLACSDDALLAQMKPKGRYNIHVARRHGVRVVDDISESGIDAFLAIHRETVERHSLNAERARYYRALCQSLRSSGQGTLLFAARGDERLAAAVIVYSGDRATYLFGGSRQADRRYMAPYLLHIEAMSRARDAGMRWYDFYGIAPTDSTEHPWAGITRFKRQFGGVAQCFIPSLELIYDRPGYEAYRAARRGRQASGTGHQSMVVTEPPSTQDDRAA